MRCSTCLNKVSLWVLVGWDGVTRDNEEGGQLCRCIRYLESSWANGRFEEMIVRVLISLKFVFVLLFQA
jgi:hypothetical protein